MNFQFEVIGRDKEELFDKAVAELVKVTGIVRSALPTRLISQSITARPFRKDDGAWGVPSFVTEQWIGFVDVEI